MKHKSIKLELYQKLKEIKNGGYTAKDKEKVKGMLREILNKHKKPSQIHEDDEAKQRGWKHLGFGTYEDSSGKRYKRDDSGNWKELGVTTTSAPKASSTPAPSASSAKPNVHDEYEARVGELEGEGLDRGDAQGIADTEFEKKYGRGWERDNPKSSAAPKKRDAVADMISKIEDKGERKYLTAMSKIADLPDDGDFLEGFRSEPLADDRSEIFSDLRYGQTSSYGNKGHLQDMHDSVDRLSRRLGIEREYVIDGLESGEIDMDDDTIAATRVALKGSAEESAKWHLNHQQR